MHLFTIGTLAGLALAAPQLERPSKRDNSCPAEPVGYGPVPIPDTPADFLSSSAIQSLATKATLPSGYTLAYQNLNSSLTAANYMGYFTVQSYDPSVCASACDNTKGCTAFNIYMERSPTMSPDDTNCPNPPSTNKIGCSFWGTVATTQAATNYGQWRSGFNVVIAGSNAYNKVTWTSEAVGNAAMSQVIPGTTAGTAFNTTLDGAGVSIKVSQPISVVSNQQYVFNANFLINNGVGSCTMYAQPPNLNVPYYLQRYPTGSWQSMQLYFNGAYGNKMGIYVTCDNATAGVVAFDNVRYAANNGPTRGNG